MKIYTLAECKKFLQEQGYKHVSLQTSDGRDVVKYNTSKMKPEERIEQMETRLSSPTLPDGYYIFLGKYNMQRDSVPDKFYIAKGDVKELDKQPEVVTDPAKPEKNALTYDQAIKMNKKIAELTAQLGTTQSERDEYRGKYYELLAEVEEIANETPDEEEEEPEGILSEENIGNVGKFVESISANLIPIFDRHYDLKAKALEIEEGKVIERLVRQGFVVPPAHNNGNTENAARQQKQTIEVPELSEEERAGMTPEEQHQYDLLVLAEIAQKDPVRYREIVEQMNAGTYTGEPEEGMQP